MGYNTVAVILNDGIDLAGKDPEFGRRVHEAVRGWHRRDRDPMAVDASAVAILDTGGTASHCGVLRVVSQAGRTFRRGFATLFRTLDGPEWTIIDPKDRDVPIEWWTEAGGPHPEFQIADAPLTAVRRAPAPSCAWRSGCQHTIACGAEGRCIGPALNAGDSLLEQASRPAPGFERASNGEVGQ